MKIVVTGGGSGGHITPILAVAAEIKARQPDCRIIYIGQRGDGLSDIPAQDKNIDEVYTVWAGKLRRYADENWLRRLLDVRTQALNLRDLSRLLRGVWQSYFLFRRLRPDVLFSRGGFVSVPVALGGHLNHIPYITHDSDSVPSLANRIIARWAALHAVALSADSYPYPATKTVSVGVPVSARYQVVTADRRTKYLRELGIDCRSVVLLTGGGNGSSPLNQALIRNTRYLLGTYPDLAIVHITGRQHQEAVDRSYDSLELGNARKRIVTKDFVTDLYRYSAVADVVIARGGASTLAEFALQAKACVIVPAPQLASDHQTKNANALAEAGAIMKLSEDQLEQPERLGRVVGGLLDDDQKRLALAKRLHGYAHPEAAHELAALIIKVGQGADVRSKN